MESFKPCHGVKLSSQGVKLLSQVVKLSDKVSVLHTVRVFFGQFVKLCYCQVANQVVSRPTMSYCQCVILSICYFVNLSFCQSVNVSLSVCQFVSLSICQLVSLSVCHSVRIISSFLVMIFYALVSVSSFISYALVFFSSGIPRQGIFSESTSR